MSFFQGDLLVCTYRNEVISNPPTDVSTVSPCDHEEADTRILLHVAAAVEEGHNAVTIRTVDSDVVVIATSLFPRLNDSGI